MSITKQPVKDAPISKVTFTMPKEATGTAKTVHIVGDFNNWNNTATPLKKQKNGCFTVTLNLEKGKEYQFRYLINQTNWENDWEADKYVQTQYSDAENSVVIV